MELAGEDGSVQVFSGKEAIASIFTGTAARWSAKAQPAGRHYVRHFTSTHQVDFVDEEHATGRSYFMVLMPHGLDHWGRYLDQYERRNGRWLFVRRRAVTDGFARGHLDSR